MKKSIAILLTLILVLGFGALGVSADDFIPSKEKNDVPEIVVPSVGEDVTLPEGVEKEDVGAVINKGGEKTAVAIKSIVTLTLSEAKKNITDNVADSALLGMSNALMDAYNAISEKNGDVSGIKEIADAAKDLGIEKPEYAVEEIFEINLGESNDDLKEDGTSVTIVFENTFGAVAGKVIVAHMVGNDWKTVAKDKVVVDKDNITVEFDELCPVMFISVDETSAGGNDTAESQNETTKEAETTKETEKESSSASTPAPTDDGDNGNVTKTVIVVVVVCVVAAGAVVAIYLLYKNGKFDKLVKKKNKIVHPDRAAYKKSKKAKKWSGKKKIRKQRRSRRSGK